MIHWGFLLTLIPVFILGFALGGLSFYRAIKVLTRVEAAIEAGAIAFRL